MREVATSERIDRFLGALAQVATEPTTVYLVGGATAVLIGWRESTRDIDLVFAQALAKIERGHVRDLADVRAMLDAGLVTANGLRAAFAEAESALYRYPAVDPESYRQALDRDIRCPTSGSALGSGDQRSEHPRSDIRPATAARNLKCEASACPDVGTPTSRLRRRPLRRASHVEGHLVSHLRLRAGVGPSAVRTSEL